jgi:hypothetical protein
MSPSYLFKLYFLRSIRNPLPILYLCRSIISTEDVKKVGFLPASVEREIVFSNKGNSAIM